MTGHPQNFGLGKDKQPKTVERTAAPAAFAVPSPLSNVIVFACDRCGDVLVGHIDAVYYEATYLGWARTQGFDLCPDCIS